MVRRLQLIVVSCLTLAAMACGGESAPGMTPTPDPNGTGNGGGGTSVKRLTATITPIATVPGQQLPPGQSFVATLVVGSSLGGALTVNGTNATSSLTINILNIAAGGTYSLGLGNPNSGLATWIDPNGMYRSQTNNGSGTLFVQTANLSRVTGTFDFVANDSPAGAGSTLQIRVRVTGSFDITNP